MALSPDEMDAAVLRNLAERSGLTLVDWITRLEASGPFAKPAEAVAWLKTQHGLGHVTAQILVRKWKNRDRPTEDDRSIETILGLDGAVVFDQLVQALRQSIPTLEVMPRKTYVGLGTGRQFAVAVRPKSGAAQLWIGLIAQDKAQAPLPKAPKLGGSDRFIYLLEVESRSDLAGSLAHLRAAAGVSI